MYTPTNAYSRKFSSGLLLALLAVSGLMFLLPIATVNASNASLPSISISPNVVAAGTLPTATISITNPGTNAYAITAFTVTAPSGWSFTAGSALGTYFSCTDTTSSAACTLRSSTNPLAPGASDAIGVGALTPSAPATTSASVGTFTSSVQDASSLAYYTGPSFKVYGTGTTPTVTISFPTGDPCSGATYTAGSGACAATATLATANNFGYVGVPVVFSTGATSASASPTSGTTGSGGAVSTSFSPSNLVANNPNNLKATLGTSAIASTVFAINTAATTPVSATFYIGATAFLASATHYIGGASNALSSAIGGTGPNDATMAASSMSVAATDKFGNPITLSGVTGLAISVSTTAAQGVFYSAGNHTTVTYAATFVSNAGVITVPYYQLGAYRSTDVLTATISGTAPSFTVSGSSGALTTTTFDGASVAPIEDSHDCVSPCYAGSTISLHSTTTPAQRGVPVIFYLDTATSTQANGDGTQSVSTTTGANGTAGALFTLDTGVTTPLYFLAQFGDASQVSGHLANSTDSALMATQAGPAAALVFQTYFDTALSLAASHAVNGSTLYVDVSLADKYGNPTLNTFPYQIPITLSGPGTFSASSVYIPSGKASTAAVGSFGPILWTAPNSFGTVTLSAASTFPTATAKVTLVSATPTFAVTSPKPLNGVIYSGSTAVTFQGQANVSLGYPSTTHIVSIGYSVDGGHWATASVAPGNAITWAVSVFMTAGTHTVQFNATDNSAAANTVVSQKFSVLVDSKAPDVNYVTKSNANISSPATVSANIVDASGDLNASSVSAVATNIDTSATKTLTASVTGTNNPGSSVTYAVTISGLTTGNWSVALSATDYAGNTNSSTITVHVTVPFAQSFAVSGTPASSTLGQFAGISASYTNLNPTSQNVVIFAVFKNSAGQTMGIGTGSATFGAGSTQSVFIADPVGLASGAYSVSIFVFTTGNLPVSVSTTISVTV